MHPSQASGPGKRVAIIGAGAAGYFAAIKVAEADPSCSVNIYEASRRALTKVSISGGGRCNVTHHCFDPRELVRFYPRGAKELRGAFHTWQPQDTVDWFAARGVPLKTEADGRMFPTSDSSQTIIDCLTEAGIRAGVRLNLKTSVSSISLQGDNLFSLSLSNGETVHADAVLVATGGGQKNAGHQIAQQFGHTIAPLAPSLFTFHIEHPLLAELQGVSLPKVRVSYPAAKLEQSGPVVFTHWGLSGPGILKLSAWGARVFKDLDYRCELVVNWTGEQKQEEIRSALETFKSAHPRRALSSGNPFDFPKRFWERILDFVSISSDLQWSQLPKKTSNQIVETLFASRLPTSGKSMNKDEFVTCGGIHLKEVDFRTMQSKKQPGLFFAGEVLDIDGVTGGFNFQAAWTTAHIAASAIAQPSDS